MLTVNGLSSGYEGAQVLHDVSFDVRAGEIVCLLGRNGAGKSTCLKTIMGLIRASGGRVECDGVEVSRLPANEVPRHGIGYIPQGRRLFAELTVAENLEIGLMVGNRDHDFREQVLEMFPRLRERLNQRADTLSGGEQQMLATGRALCIDPSVLLLDEPTEGLQPSMIEQIRQAVTALRARGVAILLVEQRVEAVLSIADRVVFLENGRSHARSAPPNFGATPTCCTVSSGSRPGVRSDAREAASADAVHRHQAAPASGASPRPPAARISGTAPAPFASAPASAGACRLQAARR